MEWLQSTGTIIILIASITTAIVTIFTNIGKPIIWGKKRGNQNLRTKIAEVLNEILPDMLYKHDLETRDKYKADRERYLQEIKGEVLKSIQCQLGAVSNLEEQYMGLQKQYETLAISAKDVLREKIMIIYHKNKGVRQLEEHEKEALDQYYKDYKNMGGNSYIDKYYARMERWNVVCDDYGESDHE